MIPVKKSKPMLYNVLVVSDVFLRPIRKNA